MAKQWNEQYNAIYESVQDFYHSTIFETLLNYQ